MLKKCILTLSLILTSLACSEKKQSQPDDFSDLSSVSPKVIYGNDSRRDWNEVLDPELLDLADSTVGILDSASVSINGQNALIETRSSNLCQSEKFSDQRKGPWCSGFLVAPNLIVTAGHCVTSTSQCRGLSFIFGYAKKTASNNPAQLNIENVYHCEELIDRKLTSRSSDWALVRLNRPVTNHRPLKIRRSGTVALNTPLTLIGHPSGLPSKIARDGLVRSVSSAHFAADLDSYGGNSGSAVFNSNTNEIEGILVRGRTDYIYKNGCYVSNICREGLSGKCTGSSGGIEAEHITKISELAHLIPRITNDDEAPPIEDPEDEPGEEPAPEDPAVFTSNVAMPIYDTPHRTLYSKIKNVPSLFSPNSLKISVSVEHTYISDLTIRLIAPNRRVVLLHNKTGNSTVNINGVYGADLTSAEPLSSLGSQPSGTWTLEIIDHIPYDKGTLVGWAISF